MVSGDANKYPSQYQTLSITGNRPILELLVDNTLFLNLKVRSVSKTHKKY